MQRFVAGSASQNIACRSRPAPYVWKLPAASARSAATRSPHTNPLGPRLEVVHDGAVVAQPVVGPRLGRHLGVGAPLGVALLHVGLVADAVYVLVQAVEQKSEELSSGEGEGRGEVLGAADAARRRSRGKEGTVWARYFTPRTQPVTALTPKEDPAPAPAAAHLLAVVLLVAAKLRRKLRQAGLEPARHHRPDAALRLSGQRGRATSACAL